MPDEKKGLLGSLPVIGGVLNAVGGILNPIFQRGATNRQHAWEEQMYGWQRRDALADWNMQNEYNSPKQQMQRLHEAGLNPNLVYGSGADAISTQGVRSSSVPGGSADAPRLDLAPAMASFYDLQLKGAQTDNVRAATEASIAQKELSHASAKEADARTLKTYAEIPGVESAAKSAAVQALHAEEFAQTSLEGAKAGIRRTNVETNVLAARSAREAMKQNQELKNMAEQVLHSRMERVKMASEVETNQTVREKLREEMREIQYKIDNLSTDANLKKLDLQLKRDGIQPHDNAIFRWLYQLGMEHGDKMRSSRGDSAPGSPLGGLGKRISY